MRSSAASDMNTRSKLVKKVLIVLGTLFTGLGVIGIFIPILPTTPFLLLAAACYARGSERFYNWLLSNRLFGNYIKNYREGKGIPITVKIVTISLLWLTILFSALVIVQSAIIRIILIAIAIGVTTHIMLVRTLKIENK